MTFLRNEKTIILSKLTGALIYLLFHQMLALLWSPFVLSPQCYFTSSPSKKICLGFLSVHCFIQEWNHATVKNRLERTAELFPAWANTDGQGEVHAKQNLKCSSEHFSSLSHRSHFGLVKWIFAKGFFSRPFPHDSGRWESEIRWGGNFK